MVTIKGALILKKFTQRITIEVAGISEAKLIAASSDEKLINKWHHLPIFFFFNLDAHNPLYILDY